LIKKISNFTPNAIGKSFYY